MNNHLNQANTRTEAVTGLRYVWPFLVVVALLSLFFIDLASSYMTADEPLQELLMTIKRIYWSFYNSLTLLPPLLYIGVPLLFILELIRPAKQGSQLFGSNTREDLLYTVALIPFYGVTAPLFFAFLHQIYDQYFWFISISSSIEHSRIAEVILGYLLIDFHGWLHHFVRHKVPVFWDFHTVHHSQDEMNPFTNLRVHPVDWFISNTIKFIPAFFFADALDVALSYIFIHRLLDRLNHSNVRTNLGPLRYIMVTPQSHRVHHSSRKEHQDTNFGVSLSIWDHLFGTQCRDYDAYPETGIVDRKFPLETAEDTSLFALVRVFIQQMIYPFVVVFQKTFPGKFVSDHGMAAD
jgi:sterol desaturase/sphingolipid hydroxylase (fatty acid hydroxylase superfamily)